jgi:predicted dehydrogenase
MTTRSSRREFLRKGAALAGMAALPRFWIGKDPRIAFGFPANEKLRIGVVGVANRGAENLNGVAASSSAQVVALCDVDSNYLAAAATRFPEAKQFRDWRKMLGEMASGGLDGVVVSTPDHLHAPVSAAALRAKLHVYCEKPLTHTVTETRTLMALARKAGVATQMGTQIHANANYRRVVELVKSGAIGDVKDVHVWVGNNYGGVDRPKETPPVPPNLDWDLWLGPAPERPYSEHYAPFWWRGWWDFGSGSLGDMACHHVDLSFWALDLEGPESIEADGPPVHPESTPTSLTVKYVMRKKGGGTVPLTWYDGGKRPHHFADGLLPQWGNGTLFVGSKGMLLADYDRLVLLPEADFAGFVAPPPSIPDSIGHYEEWLAAAKGGAPALCNFDYSGPLTIAVLLGNVAYRAQKKLSWDAAKGTTGDAAADALLLKQYRKGWTLETT